MNDLPIGLDEPHPRQQPASAPLRVLLLSDGRPGHYRQSEGIVAALRRAGAVTVDRLDLATRLPMPKAFIPKLARRMPAAWLLRAVHGLDPDRIQRPDVIVSAGGATLGANVALARTTGAPNVFSGSTRGFPLSAFRLVLTPYDSVATSDNVVAGPKPSPFDPDRVPAGRDLNGPGDLRGARLSVLVGGPTASAGFDGEDWSRLRGLLVALVADYACRLTIVTSPRTPDAAYAEIRALVAAAGDAVLVIDYRTAGAGSIETAFDCDVVLITSDSMSMMTEAAVSRRPAIALAPRVQRPHRDDEAVAGLVAARWLAVVPLSATDAPALARTAAALQPMAWNHLDRLATAIRSRL